jgi:hypothetical protein
MWSVRPSIDTDPSLPLLTARTPGDADRPTGTVDTSVALILRRGDDPQVFYPVVVADAVLVIDLSTRPFAGQP